MPSYMSLRKSLTSFVKHKLLQATLASICVKGKSILLAVSILSCNNAVIATLRQCSCSSCSISKRQSKDLFFYPPVLHDCVPEGLYA